MTWFPRQAEYVFLVRRHLLTAYFPRTYPLVNIFFSSRASRIVPEPNPIKCVGHTKMSAMFMKEMLNFFYKWSWMTICVKLLNSSICFCLLIRSFSSCKFLKSVQSSHRALEAPAMYFLWGRLPFSIQFLSKMRSAAFFWCWTSCSTDFRSPMDKMFLSAIFTWFTWSQFLTWSSVCWTLDKQSVCVSDLFSRFVFDFKIKLSELFYPSGQYSVWFLKTI